MSSDGPDTRTRILQATWRLMEQRRGQAISMGDVAKAVGISRQAVYLHFASRAELIVATSNYVDEVKGLNARLGQLQAATSGTELLAACVEVWGNYIPEIYGLAKALLATRDTDEATAAAWDANMQCLRDVCRQTVLTLEREGVLASEWTPEQATEMFWTLISINNWEQLTIECGWSTDQYIDRMKMLVKRTFVDELAAN
ncbi:MAG: TetR family transcriptional regulator [Thiotrichales bacterium SG8_50]|nr:MAG: TetR family transcriptional regulator [Thiotrichales bacterium SG8_50]